VTERDLFVAAMAALLVLLLGVLVRGGGGPKP
jgi:hypothetical protein